MLVQRGDFVLSMLIVTGILAIFMGALFIAGRALVTLSGWRRMLYSGAGLGSLLALHFVGAGVGLNLFTVMLSLILGVPGTAMIWTLGML